LKKKGKGSRLPTLVTSCDEQVFSTFDKKTKAFEFTKISKTTTNGRSW
jgi:hypothetical protein